MLGWFVCDVECKVELLDSVHTVGIKLESLSTYDLTLNPAWSSHGTALSFSKLCSDLLVIPAVSEKSLRVMVVRVYCNLHFVLLSRFKVFHEI
jgi:hypothetical protein